MENEAINSKILELWKTYSSECGDQNPVLYSEFKKNGILFIGLNPSSSDKYLKKISKETDINRSPEDIKGKLRDKNKPDIDFLISLEDKANKVSPYFKKIKEISNELKKRYHHIDLFYFRDKTQEEAKKKIGVSVEKGKKIHKLTPFAINQLNIAIDIIEEINPEVIVVINALSSDIIKEIPNSHIDNLSDRFEISDEPFFDDNGYDLLELKFNKKKSPILFSSMLSGQRALDKHSYRMLKWHINKILSPRPI